MTTRQTVQIGDPVLRETADFVIDFDSLSLKQLITDLTDTMREDNLVGIAAPQIGESLQIFISEIRADNWRGIQPKPLTVYINPEIVNVSHETELDYEGCGSIADGQLFGKVERAREVTVKYQDSDGVSHETTATGLLSRVIQHEIDHLNGVLFTDICDPKSLVSREWYINNVKK